MIPQLIDRSASSSAVCELAAKWRIHPELAIRLRQLAQLLPVPVKIISGARTCAQQQQLEEEGRPAAACEVSTHTTCPATGADLQLETPSAALKLAFGMMVEAVGLRWGGGSARVAGIPLDWNHVDLGPRGA